MSLTLETVVQICYRACLKLFFSLRSLLLESLSPSGTPMGDFKLLQGVEGLGQEGNVLGQGLIQNEGGSGFELGKTEGFKRAEGRQKVVKRSNKEQGMGEVSDKLVWGDFMFPKEAMKLQITLCQIILFWRYWPKVVPQWWNIESAKKECV